MVSKRKAVEARAQWDDQVRLWATNAGRVLALDLYHGRHTATRPYAVGVVLDRDETALSEVPVRFNRDWPAPLGPGQRIVMPAIRPWLVTSGRVVGRLADQNLYGYRWEKMVGARVDLTPGHETLAVDIDGVRPLEWSGAGLAPMAVAAVFHLYGPAAMIEHPGLAPLRPGEARRQTTPMTVANLDPAPSSPA
jgi:hypothetical protein